MTFLLAKLKTKTSFNHNKEMRTEIEPNKCAVVTSGTESRSDGNHIAHDDPLIDYFSKTKLMRKCVVF